MWFLFLFGEVSAAADSLPDISVIHVELVDDAEASVGKKGIPFSVWYCIISSSLSFLLTVASDIDEFERGR